MSPEKLQLWLIDKNAFSGESAIDRLSEINPDQLKVNLLEIIDIFRERMNFTSYRDISLEEIEQVWRLLSN